MSCRREIHDESIVWRMLKDRKISTDLMFVLGLSETIDQLAMANSVHWYSHMLRREDGPVLRSALHFEVDGQRKKGRPKRIWKKRVNEESIKVGLKRKDLLCHSKWSVSINRIAVGLRRIWPPSHIVDNTRL